MNLFDNYRAAFAAASARRSNERPQPPSGLSDADWYAWTSSDEMHAAWRAWGKRVLADVAAERAALVESLPNPGAARMYRIDPPWFDVVMGPTASHGDRLSASNPPVGA